MPQFLKPTQIIKNFQTTTTQGEVTVNINLALTIQMENGELKVSAKQDNIPDFIPQIPDWEPVKSADLIDFGKE